MHTVQIMEAVSLLIMTSSRVRSRESMAEVVGEGKVPGEEEVKKWRGQCAGSIICVHY